MVRRPAGRSTKKPARRPARARAKPAMHKVLREVLERLPKDTYDRTAFEIDGQGRVRHGWHAAHTLYVRASSAWVKVGYWCARCKVGQLVQPKTPPVDR